MRKRAVVRVRDGAEFLRWERLAEKLKKRPTGEAKKKRV
jgi:hypothetical protein